MQQTLKQTSSSLRPQAHHSSRPRALARLHAVSTSTVEAPTAASTTAAAEDGLKDIYVGKGRYVKDDPKKYPGKDDMGPFIGAVGGWAGGEAALLQLREQLQREKAAKKAVNTAVSSSSSSAKVQPPAPKDGKAPIYLGYSKDELEVRKSGAPGRFVLDDPTKYPGKEDVGLFPGATGGFAGGEAGLKQFVATGELKLRDPSQPGAQRQTSPVAVAGLLAAGGAGGGLLLNQFFEVGEGAIKAEILEAPIDEKTKTLLVVAIGLLAAVGALAGGKALVDALQNRITSAGDQATKLVVGGAFWMFVFVAARFILEL